MVDIELINEIKAVEELEAQIEKVVKEGTMDNWKVVYPKVADEYLPFMNLNLPYSMLNQNANIIDQ